MLSGLLVQAQSKEWLHIHVNDPVKEETVRINVPIALMETLLPMVQENSIHNGKIHFDDKSVSKAELKKLWASIKQEGDTDYMTIEKPGEKVTVSMQGVFRRQTDDHSNKRPMLRFRRCHDAMLLEMRRTGFGGCCESLEGKRNQGNYFSQRSSIHRSCLDR
jgi:hypothetical protein